jgi:hypothetical protein
MLQKRRKHLTKISAQIPKVPKDDSSQARLILNESNEIDLNLRTHVFGLATLDYRTKSQTIQSEQNV